VQVVQINQAGHNKYAQVILSTYPTMAGEVSFGKAEHLKVQ